MINYQLLITNYKNHLQKKRLSKKSIKNYVSDVRRFLKWALPIINNQSSITNNLFSIYRSHLLDSKIPTKTINRHLSSLRQFGSFLVESGFTKNNPAESLASVKEKKDEEIKPNKKESILEQFRQLLENQRLSQKTITNYISDVSQFLEFLNSKNL